MMRRAETGTVDPLFVDGPGATRIVGVLPVHPM